MTVSEKEGKIHHVFHDNQTPNTIVPYLALDIYCPRLPEE